MENWAWAAQSATDPTGQTSVRRWAATSTSPGSPSRTTSAAAMRSPPSTPRWPCAASMPCGRTTSAAWPWPPMARPWISPATPILRRKTKPASVFVSWWPRPWSMAACGFRRTPRSAWPILPCARCSSASRWPWTRRSTGPSLARDRRAWRSSPGMAAAMAGSSRTARAIPSCRCRMGSWRTSSSSLPRPSPARDVPGSCFPTSGSLNGRAALQASQPDRAASLVDCSLVFSRPLPAAPGSPGSPGWRCPPHSPPGLAAAGLGQVVSEPDVPGLGDRPDLLGHPLPQQPGDVCRLGAAGPRTLEDDEGAYGLSCCVIGPPHDGGLRHQVGHGHQGGLDLHRAHAVAADVEHIVDAAGDGEVAGARIADRAVSRQVVAALEFFGKVAGDKPLGMAPDVPDHGGPAALDH